MNTLPRKAMPGLVLAVLAVGGCAHVRDAWRPAVEPPRLRGALAARAEAKRLPHPEDVPDDAPADAPTGPVEVTIEDAVLRALENNRALRVERLEPAIQRTFVEQELAAFDTVVSGEASAGRERVEGRTGAQTRTTTSGVRAGASRLLPTGTTIDASVATERSYGTALADQHATGASVSVTQAMLEGRPVAVNLANLRQARVDEALSQHEFRGFAEALVAEVETTYWRYVLARRQVEIVTRSLDLAEQQLDDTRRRIRVGDLAETELAAGEAEVALRREALINARSLVATLQVRLLRLMYPQALPTREREVVPQTRPLIPPIPLEKLSDHVTAALHMRPELHQAALLVQRSELEVVKTRNGLLPQLDLFVTLGKTGYASSFGESVRDVGSDGYETLVGLTFSQPVTNRDARARHARAVATRAQRREAVRNLRDLVREDVELAYIEVTRARQQVQATTTTREFQEEKLRAETAKFRVGRSTALLVASAQRDLLASQVAEIEAVTNSLVARVELYRLEGSLLARRGLMAEPPADRSSAAFP